MSKSKKSIKARYSTLSQSKNIKVKVEEGNKIQKMIENTIRSEVDDLLFKIMIFRGKPFEMSNIEYDQDYIDKKLEDIFNNTKIDEQKIERYGLSDKVLPDKFNIEKFKEELSIFTEGQDDNYKGFLKDSNPQNSFSSYIYDKGSDKLTIPKSKTPYLACSSLFPLKKDHNCKNLSKSIILEVSSRLKSFNELSEERKKEHDKIEKFIEENSVDFSQSKSKNNDGKLDKIAWESYVEFVEEMIEGHFIPKFNKNNLKKLIGFFKRNVKQLREVHEKYGDDFVFQSKLDLEENKIKTGYSCDLINRIYSHYKPLWEENEHIEAFAKIKSGPHEGKEYENCIAIDNKYANLILDLFKYMLKEHINISKFKDKDNFPGITFGNGSNFAHYKMHVKDDIIYFGLSNPLDPKKRLTCTCRVPGHLKDLEVIEELDKNVYKLKFNMSTDNNKGLYTEYMATLKQPKLRYDIKSKGFIMDLSLSEVISSNDMFIDNKNFDADKETISKGRQQWANTQDYYNTSYFTAKFFQPKSTLELDDFNVLGVDLGLRPSIAFAVARVTKDKDGHDDGSNLVKYEFLKSYHSRTCSKEALEPISKVNDLANAVRYIISDTKKHVHSIEDEKLGRKVYNVNIAYSKLKYEDVIKEYSEHFSIEEYLKWVEENLVDIDKKKWKERRVGWIVPQLINIVKKEYSKIRSSYFNSKDKSHYTKYENFVSNKHILLIKATKSVISMHKSYMFTGLNEEECNKEREYEVCKDLYNYQNGLRKRINRDMASLIINHAVNNNCKVIFIENLDLKTKYTNSKDENEFISLLGFSGLIEKLEFFASKHSICLVKINHDMTSQIDSETGRLGYRDTENKSNLYVERDNKIYCIDSDENAAKNIAIRGITRHSMMPAFKATPYSDNGFIITLVDKGDDNQDAQKQIKGSLMNYLSSEKPEKYVVCKKSNFKYEMKVVSKEEFDNLKKQSKKYIEKEKKKKSGKDKITRIIKSGNDFYPKEIIEEEVKTYKDRFFNG